MWSQAETWEKWRKGATRIGACGLIWFNTGKLTWRFSITLPAKLFFRLCILTLYFNHVALFFVIFNRVAKTLRCTSRHKSALRDDRNTCSSVDETRLKCGVPCHFVCFGLCVLFSFSTKSGKGRHLHHRSARCIRPWKECRGERNHHCFFHHSNQHWCSRVNSVKRSQSVDRWSAQRWHVDRWSVSRNHCRWILLSATGGHQFFWNRRRESHCSSHARIREFAQCSNFAILVNLVCNWSGHLHPSIWRMLWVLYLVCPA